MAHRLEYVKDANIYIWGDLYVRQSTHATALTENSELIHQKLCNPYASQPAKFTFTVASPERPNKMRSTTVYREHIIVVPHTHTHTHGKHIIIYTMLVESRLAKYRRIECTLRGALSETYKRRTYPASYSVVSVCLCNASTEPSESHAVYIKLIQQTYTLPHRLQTLHICTQPIAQYVYEPNLTHAFNFGGIEWSSRRSLLSIHPALFLCRYILRYIPSEYTLMTCLF